MEKRKRTQLVLGLLLILVAGWLIATRINPELADLIKLPAFEWPMWVVLSGAGLLLLGLLIGSPGMAVPACIVAGVGGILYYQNATGNWFTWYLWLLVPGFGGIGNILAGLLGDDLKKSLREGFNGILFSVIAFAVCASLFGGWNVLGDYGQYALIAIVFLVGIWFIVRGFVRRK